MWLSCLYALSADHFIVRLGFLRDHAINFAVVVNIDHAYLDIRHKGVQGGDEMRAPLFWESGDDVNGAFLFGEYTLICAFSFFAHSYRSSSTAGSGLNPSLSWNTLRTSSGTPYCCAISDPERINCSHLLCGVTQTRTQFLLFILPMSFRSW